MNKINNFSNYYYKNSVSFSSGNNVKSLNDDNNCYHINNNQYMTPQISASVRSYGLSCINTKISQMPLQNLIKLLEIQGKKEGQDFEIDSSSTMGNTVVILKDKKDNARLIIHYDNGDYTKWNFYETNEYKNGQIYKNVCRDTHGDIITHTQYYKTDDVKYLDEYLTPKTTLREYEQYLKDNCVKYSINYSDNEAGNKTVNIDLLDENDNIKDSLWFHYKGCNFDEPATSISKSNYNKNGKEYRRINYYGDNTVGITSYLNLENYE